MDPSIFTIGTEFFEQSLWDKDVGITFCNPPYSHFGKWVAKIIRESVSPSIYIIVPKRWRDNQDIKDAIRDKGDVETEVLGSFSFSDAERQARAEVDIIYIDNSSTKNDPFEEFFNSYFGEIADKFDDSEVPEEDKDAAEKEFTESQRKLVPGKNMVESLFIGYQDEQQRIIDAYNKVGDIDRFILDELDIDKSKLVTMLREKVINLKKKYWRLLFENFDGLTSRLTSKTRKEMMERLNKETSVDFTISNAYSIIIWGIKQVNKYVDDQLCDVFERLVGEDSVYAYKSNEKVFVGNYWRYDDQGEKGSHFALDYRIVSSHSGGLSVNEYAYGREKETNLNDRAYDMVSDILTVANNLGFSTKDGETPHRLWGRGAEFFHLKNGTDLLKVRAYKNQNLHLFINQDVMLALNVEYGRLRGWLNSPEEAAKELDDPKALELFNTNMQLGQSSVPLLTQGIA
jgi:hypothetical protein